MLIHQNNTDVRWSRDPPYENVGWDVCGSAALNDALERRLLSDQATEQGEPPPISPFLEPTPSSISLLETDISLSRNLRKVDSNCFCVLPFYPMILSK